MAITTTAATRKHSRGTRNEQVLDVTIGAADTTATLTATSLSTLNHAICGFGLIYTAAPTYSRNTVTLTFSAPGGTGLAGSVLCIGR